MAVSSRDETLGGSRCAAPGCANALVERDSGRPARFCSPACRSRAHRSRTRHNEAFFAEVQLGSTSSKGRTHGRVWMVCLRRGSDSLIVATGLARQAADRLAQRMTEMIGSSV